MRAFLNLIGASCVALGIALASPALASSPGVANSASFPSSDENFNRFWSRMNLTTFPVSSVSVLEQFDRVSKIDSRLTPEKRARLMTLLETNQGTSIMVPDGIGLDYLTGRNQGKPWVYQGMVKQLGRLDRALLFDLGDGVYIYWFTGVAGQSCNNIGIVIKRPPVPVVAAAPLIKRAPQWKIVPGTSTTIYAPMTVYNTGIYIPGCNPNCCPPQYVNGAAMQLPSSVTYSTPYRMVVEDDRGNDN